MKANDNNLNLPSDPCDGFARWLQEAKDRAVPEPTAMTLATVSADGRPHARIVLFKGFGHSAKDSVDERKTWQFFTNYESQKSQELSATGRAALVFFWAPLARQIRVEGAVQKLTRIESEAYFQTRPRGSQIGAWSSPQSRKIAHRKELEQLVHEMERKFTGKEVTCPPHWGGWQLTPERIEFWQGVDNRLHDRFVYEWQASSWLVSRLAP